MSDPAPDFSDLSAVFINCTLERSPRRSRTGLLLEVPAEIMRSPGAR